MSLCVQPGKYVKAGRQGSRRMGEVALGDLRLPANPDTVRARSDMYRPWCACARAYTDNYRLIGTALGGLHLPEVSASIRSVL